MKFSLSMNSPSASIVTSAGFMLRETQTTVPRNENCTSCLHNPRSRPRFCRKQNRRVLGLLLTATVLAPQLANAGEPDEGQSARVLISSFSRDEDIRRKLLEYTPPGTSGVDVLSFIIDRIRPSRPVNAYSAYDRAYEAAKGEKSSATPITAKKVWVVVAERWVPLLSSERVEATWQFDDNDQVADIKIERTTIGP